MNPWVRAACGRDPLRSMRETRGGNFRATEEAPDGDPSRVGCAPGADHVRRLNTETGEVLRGRFRADREAVGEWVGQFAGEQVQVAVEACTGWLFVYEVLAAAGAVAHLAEPVQTSALRGKKRHAKTDRADARWLRTLLAEGRLPEAWIPPAHVREWRTQTRLRKTLIDERTCWLQRIQATLS